MSTPVLTDEIFWQVCDPDAQYPTRESHGFSEGKGFEALTEDLRRRIDAEPERTPEGYVPGGNIAIYWNRVVERWDD